jgi:hypothetical protein
MLRIGAAVLTALVIAFFAWERAATRRRHARLTREEVHSAVENCLGMHGDTHDEWDLFLSWPIDDSYLESVRQRCLEAWNEHGPEPVGTRLRLELEQILQELRRRAPQ